MLIVSSNGTAVNRLFMSKSKWTLFKSWMASLVPYRDQSSCPQCSIAYLIFQDTGEIEIV